MTKLIIVLVVWCFPDLSDAADTNADDQLDRLIIQLKDPDFTVRIEAAHELGVCPLTCFSLEISTEIV